MNILKLLSPVLLLLCLVKAYAAGGVVAGESGSCVIEIGFYTAHFTAYQPDSRGSDEFCEDLPDQGRALFVLDYLHDSLKKVPVDFRIIKDVDKLGRFVRLHHVQAIKDIESLTVFYNKPTIYSDGRLRIEHNFNLPGYYIGVVTAPHPSKDIIYHAVFPFEVGKIGLDYRIIGLIFIALGLTVVHILMSKTSRAKLRAILFKQ